jgi:hypothetical protein
VSGGPTDGVRVVALACGAVAGIVVPAFPHPYRGVPPLFATRPGAK